MKKHINNSKLIAYSTAAGAILAITPNAFGKIIHTTTDLYFGLGFGDINLTMEGTNPEFILFGSSYSYGSSNYYSFGAFGKSSSDLIYAPASSFAKAISSGEKISSASNIPNASIGYFSYSNNGSWNSNNPTNYCGISFKLEGGSKDTVYGWLQIIKVSKATGKLIAWAYEDTGAGIEAGEIPEPVTGLALLALGAAGIAAYRRR